MQVLHAELHFLHDEEFLSAKNPKSQISTHYYYEFIKYPVLHDVQVVSYTE